MAIFRSCGSSATLREQFNALRADVTEIRAKLIATHVKLDADAGVTDTNYAATEVPAALTSEDLTEN